jgi:hypothetical protein
VPALRESGWGAPSGTKRAERPNPCRVREQFAVRGVQVLLPRGRKCRPDGHSLLLWASSIGVDARVTPLDPRGNPNAAAAEQRVSAPPAIRGTASLRLDKQQSFAKRRLGEATVSPGSAKILLPGEEPAHQQTTKSAAAHATRRSCRSHTGLLLSPEAVAQSHQKVTVPVMVGGDGPTSPHLEPLSQSKRPIGRY